MIFVTIRLHAITIIRAPKSDKTPICSPNFNIQFQGKVDSEVGITGYVLRTALSSKLKLLRDKGVTKHSIWDSLVFNKAKKAMGMQDVRLMISGGAPLPSRTMEVINFNDLLKRYKLLHTPLTSCNVVLSSCLIFISPFSFLSSHKDDCSVTTYVM